MNATLTKATCIHNKISINISNKWCLLTSLPFYCSLKVWNPIQRTVWSYFNFSHGSSFKLLEICICWFLVLLENNFSVKLWLKCKLIFFQTTVRRVQKKTQDMFVRVGNRKFYHSKLIWLTAEFLSFFNIMFAYWIRLLNEFRITDDIYLQHLWERTRKFNYVLDWAHLRLQHFIFIWKYKTHTSFYWLFGWIYAFSL